MYARAQVMTDIMYYTADIDTAIGARTIDRKQRWEKIRKEIISKSKKRG
ncbi:unnamed protein product [Cylicostephanus goldi]|uniref:Uncharacterized protein n=1 Tax=Cylicostephanus goldi TaxID=71465 RepID=A0A3P6SF23_CYLGO|nr:unnamed protein product [Cylicostephanus goldi]